MELQRYFIFKTADGLEINEEATVDGEFFITEHGMRLHPSYVSFKKLNTEPIRSYGISMSRDGFFYLEEAEMYVGRDRAEAEYCATYLAEHDGTRLSVTGRIALRKEARDEFQTTFGGKK